MEKSLATLPKLLGNFFGSGGTSSAVKSPVGVSRGFELFVNNANRDNSKYGQEQFMKRELESVQQKLGQRDISLADMRDYLCRVVYCSSHGLDVSFACIHAVKLAQLGSGLEKRLGYLVSSVLLDENHQLILLLINTIQKDLKSSNLLDNCMALQAACTLINTEMIPMVLPLVQDKVTHSRGLVRQKAVLCLNKFVLLAPDIAGLVQPTLEKSLRDEDPGVMAATVQGLSRGIMTEPEKYKQFGQSFLNILTQIITRRMPAEYEYHSIPFPWLQIQLLQCLSKLSAVDDELRVKLHAVLEEVLQRLNSKENIAFAILYECVLTITAIQPTKSLLDLASKHVGHFLHSNVTSLRYIGVKLLTAVVKVSPQVANDYQSLVVDALEHADVAIQRKILRLLHQIANQHNVKVICNKLLEQLNCGLDKYWRSEVITMVIDLTKRLPVSMQWRWETHLMTLQQGKDCVTQAMINTLISDIQTVFAGEDGEQQRKFLLKKSFELLQRNDTSHFLILVAAWTLGENAFLLKNIPEDKVISLVTKPLQEKSTLCQTKSCIVTTLIKLLQAGVAKATTMAALLEDMLKQSHPPLIQQQLTLLNCLCKLNVDLTTVQCRGDNLDFTLSFLDGFVADQLEKGVSPYWPRNMKIQLDTGVKEYLPAADLVSPERKSSNPSSVSSLGRDRTSSGASGGTANKEQISESGLNLSGVKKVWGKQGLTQQGATDPNYMYQTQPGGAVTLSPDKSPEQLLEEKKKEEFKLALFGGSPEGKAGSSLSLTGGSLGDNLGTSDSGISSLQPLSRQQQDTLPTLDTAGWKRFHTTHTEEEKNNLTDSHENVSVSGEEIDGAVTIAVDENNVGHKVGHNVGHKVGHSLYQEHEDFRVVEVPNDEHAEGDNSVIKTADETGSVSELNISNRESISLTSQKEQEESDRSNLIETSKTSSASPASEHTGAMQKRISNNIKTDPAAKTYQDHQRSDTEVTHMTLDSAQGQTQGQTQGHDQDTEAEAEDLDKALTELLGVGSGASVPEFAETSIENSLTTHQQIPSNLYDTSGPPPLDDMTSGETFIDSNFMPDSSRTMYGGTELSWQHDDNQGQDQGQRTPVSSMYGGPVLSDEGSAKSMYAEEECSKTLYGQPDVSSGLQQNRGTLDASCTDPDLGGESEKTSSVLNSSSAQKSLYDNDEEQPFLKE